MRRCAIYDLARPGRVRALSLRLYRPGPQFHGSPGGESRLRTLILDWRGRPDLSKSGDFYSIGPYFFAMPVLGNPNGRVLVAMSSTILCDPNGQPSNREFNFDLYHAAVKRKATTNRVVWNGDSGWHTKLLDLTRPGMVEDFLHLIGGYFKWADGVHFDYASAWSWQFKDLAPKDQAWDDALVRLFTGIRAQGKLALAQQFHLTRPVLAASGAFLEQSPTSFGRTLADHAADIETFRAENDWESLFVAELRDPSKAPEEYVTRMKEWAIDHDVVLSFGRDAKAGDR